MGLLTLAPERLTVHLYVCDRHWEELVWGKGKLKERSVNRSICNRSIRTKVWEVRSDYQDLNAALLGT